MTFTLPDLEYGYDALEPFIDAETMKLHHRKHHQTYVDKAVQAIAGTPLEDSSPEAILMNLDQLPADRQTAARNHVGGHVNHMLFWQTIGPPGDGRPQGELADAIGDSFGDLDRFKAAFTEAAVGVFGSGWAWLIADGTGLRITTTPNQDSPLISREEPLLGLDVWEHAYYLKYQNRRPDYVDAWWNVVNWQRVTEIFRKASRSSSVPNI
jgi:Fe-Mn family superoxide dismutase